MKKRRILAGVLAAVLLLSPRTSVLPVHAESSAELEKQISQLQEQAEDIQEQIDALQQLSNENASKMEAAIAQKNAIDAELSLLRQQTEILDQQIQSYTLLIAEKQEALMEAQNRLAELNEKYKARIRAMEEDGELSYWSVLFEANSIVDLLDRFSMMEEIAAADRTRMAEIQQAADALAQAQAALEKENQAQKRKQAELLEAQERQEALRAESDQVLAELFAMGEEYQAYLVEQQEQMNLLSSQIDEKNEQLSEAKRQEYEQWLQSRPGTQTDPNGINWMIPTRYHRISDGYGMRMHPIHHVMMLHGGIDLAAPIGRDVWASRSGVVVMANRDYGAFGQCVVIDHNDGYKTLYAHMSYIAVEEGQIVGQGEKIGEVGVSGGVTGPHLHFEIHVDGQTVNPAEYIDFT